VAAPPTAPLELTDPSVVNGYVNGASDTAHQVVTGTAQAGAAVTVYDNSLAVGSTAADVNGAWSFVLGVLPNGSHHMTAVASNDFGTSATSAALDFVVDTVSPVPVVTDVVQAGSNSVAISGVSATAFSVSVYDNGRLIGTTSALAGSWSLTSQLSNSAIHSLTETATDVAGNTGSAAGVTLYSNQSNQTLTGGVVADLLIGRSGDKLTGGAGSDVFVFNTGFGKEVITDFIPSTVTTQGDQIEFSHNVVPDFAHVLADAHQFGNNVVITVDRADSLTLNHVTLASLHAADFSFI
jgi:Bacterial Ig-like domain